MVEDWAAVARKLDAFLERRAESNVREAASSKPPTPGSELPACEGSDARQVSGGVFREFYGASHPVPPSFWCQLDWPFWRGLVECAIMKLIPQRMAYPRFGPEGSKDRRGTA